MKRSQERRLAPARVEGEAPVIVAGDDEERGCVAVLVHKNHLDRWVDADVVPAKGADPWATKCGTDALEDSGLTNFMYKSDGENAIKTLKREVAREFRKRVGQDAIVKFDQETYEGVPTRVGPKPEK